LKQPKGTGLNHGHYACIELRPDPSIFSFSAFLSCGWYPYTMTYQRLIPFVREVTLKLSGYVFVASSVIALCGLPDALAMRSIFFAVISLLYLQRN
jgi:hypothetical protein